MPTNSCNSVVLALGEDHHSLPLCVVLREVLGLLCDLRNVICLQKQNQTDRWMSMLSLTDHGEQISEVLIKDSQMRLGEVRYF